LPRAAAAHIVAAAISIGVQPGTARQWEASARAREPG
jgi:hypothetical protein